MHTFDVPHKVRCCADGIIDENLLTRAKLTSCSALRWLCITQHFKIRVAKFYYFGDCGSATIRRWISRRWATSRRHVFPVFYWYWLSRRAVLQPIKSSVSHPSSLQLAASSACGLWRAGESRRVGCTGQRTCSVVATRCLIGQYCK